MTKEQRSGLIFGTVLFLLLTVLVGVKKDLVRFSIGCLVGLATSWAAAAVVGRFRRSNDAAKAIVGFLIVVAGLWGTRLIGADAEFGAALSVVTGVCIYFLIWPWKPLH